MEGRAVGGGGRGRRWWTAADEGRGPAVGGTAQTEGGFVPAGQSTQMIIGATPENDFQIMSVAESLYRKFDLKRVFYSAFVRVNDDSALPALPGDRRFFGNTGCIRRTGCCGFTGLRPGSFYRRSRPNFNVFLWIPSATGRSDIWSTSRWR